MWWDTLSPEKINEKYHSCPIQVHDKPGIPHFIGKSCLQISVLAGANAFHIQGPKGFYKKERNSWTQVMQLWNVLHLEHLSTFYISIQRKICK